MKIALVHEALSENGGAEKVLEQFHALYPAAPIFCPVFKPDKLPAFSDCDVRASFMQRIPGARHYYRLGFALYPFAMHHLDLSEFDVVLSSSFNFAHNVVVRSDAVHICYCHSPARFLWDFPTYARRERLSGVQRAVVSAFLPSLRANDLASAQRVDRWIATSQVVQQRIRKLYRRRSTIIPPPVPIEEFAPVASHDGYFLLIMRLVPWKCADIAIDACNRLGLRLVVAGQGRDLPRLRAMAGPTISFVGRVDGAEKADLFARCAALILPSVEDFGITPLEAMASGRPVIALGDGGALDTITPGVTGEIFREQTAESLLSVLRRFDPDAYDPWTIRRVAEPYGSENFRRRISQFVALHGAPQRDADATTRLAHPSALRAESGARTDHALVE